MQNLHTCNCVRLPVKLPSSPSHLPLLTCSPQPCLHVVHRSHPCTLTLTSHPLPPSTAAVSRLSIHVPHPTPVTSLFTHPDTASHLVLTLRSGQVYTVSAPALQQHQHQLEHQRRHHADDHDGSGVHCQPHQPVGNATLLADVTDEHDPSKSGVLACALSPDAHILALLSPAKLTLLDPSFTVLSELPLPCTASHAALSWRNDGDFLVVVMRRAASHDHPTDPDHQHFPAGSVCALVTDRTCSTVQHLDIDVQLARHLAVCVDWEPRLGGAISIAGPGNAVTFFERNGERLRRRDLRLMSNGTPKKLRWSPDSKWLAMACEESDEQGEGDAWRVAFFQLTNYRWYCKRRIIVSHRVLDIVWDEDDSSIVTIVTEREVLRMRVISVPSTMITCDDYSIAAVVDGPYVMLTDFSKAIVPPPMAHATVPCNEDIVAIAPDRHGAGFVVLTANGVLEWVMFLPSALSNPHTGSPPLVLPHPPQLTRCIRGRKLLRPARNSKYEHEYEEEAVAVASGFRMPVMPSRNCVVLVGAGGLWRDRETAQPGDALYMFLLVSPSNRTGAYALNGSQSRTNVNSEKMSASDDVDDNIDSDSDINHRKQQRFGEFQIGDDIESDDGEDVADDEENIDSNGKVVVECEETDACSNWGEAYRFLIDGHVTAIGHSSEEMSIVVVTSAGVVMRIVIDDYAQRMVEVARVTNMSTSVVQVHEVRTGGGRALTILLDEEGQLDVVDLASGRRLSVSRECTSFCVHEGFLIYTTRSHLLYCVVIDTKCTLFNPANRQSVPSIIDTLDDSSSESMPQLREGHGATRPIDRGSVIVTPLHGKTDIILQAPRGNVETISPRPVVYEVVDRLAKRREYAKAFELCRRQRVDMNHVVDADFEAFIANISHFVTQVRDPGHLSVFMTFLNGDADKINKVCKTIVQQLLLLTNNDHADPTSRTTNPAQNSTSTNNNPSSSISVSVSSSLSNSSSTSTTTTSTTSTVTNTKNSSASRNAHTKKNTDNGSDPKTDYTSAILTGLIRQQPSDIVGALRQVSELRATNVDKARSAVDFLFVLVKDEKRVYTEALGMYDLTLCSFVAECSQMDPAEYSREVHDLRQISMESERRYQIDLQLHRYDKALRHLFSCGPERHDDCVRLCHEHALYETALQLFPTAGPVRFDLLNGYAIHMRDVVGKHETAATLFLLVNKWKEAAQCYRLANKWEMAIYAIGRCDRAAVSTEEKKEFYVSVADQLAENGHVIPCARIRVSQLGDIDGAIEVLASADEWNAALEAVNSYEMVLRAQWHDEQQQQQHDEATMTDEMKQSKMDEKLQQARDCLTRHVLEGYEVLSNTLTENKDKLRERGNRLQTLIEVANKVRQSMTSSANTHPQGTGPAGGSGTGSGVGGVSQKQQHHQSEVESDVFSATSASSFGSHLSDVTFTNKTSATSLYATSSVGPGALSAAKLEKQALKRQQRMSKKRIREGHPNEREYLIGYLRKLVPNAFVRQRVHRMVDVLVFLQKPCLATKIMADLTALVQQALTLPAVVVDQGTLADLESIRPDTAMSECLAHALPADEHKNGSAADAAAANDVEMKN